jgi:hypothetical protein
MWTVLVSTHVRDESLNTDTITVLEGHHDWPFENRFIFLLGHLPSKGGLLHGFTCPKELLGACCRCFTKLVEELCGLLFPTRADALFTGTYSDVDRLYEPMIEALERAIARTEG